MASPTNISIAPAASVPPLAPALAIKPVAATASPGPGTPGSVTSKEWVIPPRPKPGRKPATDTPPTKRKAQNRAAQRAFRERRAARVNELEDQIKQIEDENEVHIAALQAKISNLSQEAEQSRTEMTWWRDRCHALEKEVAVERSAKETLVKEFKSTLSDNSNNSRNISPSQDIVPLPARSSRTRNAQIARDIRDQERRDATETEDVAMGCGDCSHARCQCIEDAFAMNDAVSTRDSSSSKNQRPHSRRSGIQRIEPEIKPDPEEMEIDFTSRFSTIHSLSEDHTSLAVSTPVDPCGFCQDGTPCICAEMATMDEQRRQRDSYENNRLAPIQTLSEFTPPPSDSDARSEVTLPSISQATNPCANGPGTCAQCQADPRRTLFCKTLAASRSAGGAAPSGCCGGKGRDGGCCQTRPTSKNSLPAGSSASSPLTLSCADTFTTLSRHPNFSRATDELASWLPKLHTLPNPKDLERLGSRPAMEVEAASVMGVLRYFDRRFADN
ncbi:hypothetical protein ASPZODRAFT_130504 [Penicilliopsis zonata CBS 506.65]|uniref:BZIP domain-containing protein n=1 Tax=Penicilliopsis zonata CBS 506.65 TaxID=1073090 RepID=A0A1L9SMX3_9EURO|nr:hypothetical protein ASPZODRAFT_130504 [Penicilliopsis zonata CBS 506.65]OJJ48466.1 hypothetical protein ASPZODRAFT_130504 [Penicilliopsis zonata CBS 506.65]